ncbi:phosphatase PAP2 family protein [Belliella sp. DSM 111904]|uniref:Phosphatase PAP2 family protein n=1 Tax=Belliella filtrata TaxID=2923435 RepID=A0ABS9V136_9BACT|nr:phosphatase PAP2 family protein [Belliella filtrata]
MIVTSIFFSLLIFFYGSEFISLTVNAHHNPFLDVFFKYNTHLGDGLIFLLFIPVIFMRKYSYGLMVKLAIVIHMIIVFVGKQIIFHGEPRPMSVFEGMSLHLVDGVKIAYLNSFPSGHTATVFLLAAILALGKPVKPVYQVLIFLAAVVVGFSRVYLMQHFLIDVLAGMWVGYSSFCIASYLVAKFPESWREFHLGEYFQAKLSSH